MTCDILAFGVPVAGCTARRLAKMLAATFLSFSQFAPHFFLLSTFLIKGVLRSKNLFSKNWQECQNFMVYTPFSAPSPIVGPPSDHFGFCSWCSIVSCERVAPPLLGWYVLHNIHNAINGQSHILVLLWVWWTPLTYITSLLSDFACRELKESLCINKSAQGGGVRDVHIEVVPT